VVEVCATAACEHTTGVVLEGGLVRLNCHGDWAHGRHGIKEARLTADISVASDVTLRNSGGEGRLAAAIAGCVWVAALCRNVSALVVAEGRVHETSIAA